MRQPIWKLAALVGIAGFGFLGLLQVQKNLHDRGVAEAAELAPEAPARKVGTARVVSKSPAPGRVRIQQTASADAVPSTVAPAGIDFRDDVGPGELVRAADADLKPIPQEPESTHAFGKAAFERQASRSANRSRDSEPKPIITPAGFNSPSKPKPTVTAAADSAAAPAAVAAEAATDLPAPVAASDFGPDPFAAFGPSPDPAASGFEEQPEPTVPASPSELLDADDPFADPPSEATPAASEPAETPADGSSFSPSPASGAPSEAQATPQAAPIESDDAFGDLPQAAIATDDVPADETAVESELVPVPESTEEATPESSATERATSPSAFDFGDDPFGDSPAPAETPAATVTEEPATIDDAPSPLPADPIEQAPAQEEPTLTTEPAAGAPFGDDHFSDDPFGSAPVTSNPTAPASGAPAVEPTPSEATPSELDFGDGTSVPLRPVTGTEDASPSAEPSTSSDPFNEGPRRLPEEGELNGIGTVSPEDPQGPQSAQLTVEKKAPPTATIGQPLVYEIIVTNVGKSPAHEVTVSDVVPKGMTLGGTSPRAAMEGKTLVWKLDTLEPGASTSIKIKATPIEAGMLGSVATVSFASEVAARTEVVAPHLTLKVSVPPQVALGQPVDFHFEIGNDGNAPAEGVLLRNVLPEGFRHADGNDLEYEVGTLPPGKTEAVTLRVAAIKAGSFKNSAMITATGGLKMESTANVEVADQKVTVTRQGPKRRFVGRPAVYANTVKNASQEIVAGIKVIEQVPAGLEFVQASHGGQFDADKRTIAWQIGPIRPGQEQTLQVVLTAAEEGVQDSVVHVEEASGGAVEVASATEVSALPSLAPTMQMPDGPIVVGERAALQIQIRNRGNADATAVSITLGLPAQLRLVEARGGQVAATPDGKNVVQFRAPLTAGGEQTVQFIVEGVSPGPARVHAEVAASHMAKPLVKDEELVVNPRG